jgi:hypothetical protein
MVKINLFNIQLIRNNILVKLMSISIEKYKIMFSGLAFNLLAPEFDI